MKVVLVSQISIDGKLTLGRGSSSKEIFDFLTENDIRFVHKIRSKVDGILVGMNTIRTDNPSLTCRYDNGKSPIRIIPTNTLNIPEGVTVLKSDVKTIFVTNEKNSDKAEKVRKLYDVDVITCGKENVDFNLAFKELEEKYNIKSIMLEGGGTLNWDLIEQDLVDEMILMQIPIIIGGQDNVTLVDGRGFRDANSVKKFKFYGVEYRGNLNICRYLRNDVEAENII